MNILSLLEPKEEQYFNCDPLTQANKFTNLMLLTLHPNINDYIDNFKLIISSYDDIIFESYKQYGMDCSSHVMRKFFRSQ